VEEKQAIHTRAATATLEAGLIRVVYRPGMDVTPDDAKEDLAAIEKLAGGRKTPLLVDLRSVRSVARDARNHFAGEDAERMVHAVAFLVDSSISKVIGNFFIGLNKPPYAAQLFTSEEPALEWCKGFLGHAPR
jgi:hypothetical protein